MLLHSRLFVLLLSAMVPALSSTASHADTVKLGRESFHPLASQDFVSRMQKELRQRGFSGDIEYCHHVNEIGPQVAGADSVYGAICHLKSGRKSLNFVHCYDEVVGHFALVSDSFIVNDETVTGLMQKYCVGG